jgi:hypothetical protein
MADDRTHVVVTDIRIPFLSLMILTIKWVLASIPAFIILWFIGMVAMMLFWALIGSLEGMGGMGGMGGMWRSL